MRAESLLRQAVEERAKNIYIVPGKQVSFKIGHSLVCKDEICTADTSLQYARELCAMAGIGFDESAGSRDLEFVCSISGCARFRCMVIRQRGSYAVFVHVVTFELPDPESCHIPKDVMKIANEDGGLHIVCSPAKHGKSTTVSCIVDEINRNKELNIIFLEDQSSYIHRHEKSIVVQREIGLDSADYQAAIRSAILKASDVLVLGEGAFRTGNLKTIIEAAESGMLVICQLNAVAAIDALYMLMSEAVSKKYEYRLSRVLKSVVAQRLIDTQSGIYPIFSVLDLDPDIKRMMLADDLEGIREKMQASSYIHTMDDSLYSLYSKDLITRDECNKQAIDQDKMTMRTDC